MFDGVQSITPAISGLSGPFIKRAWNPGIPLVIVALVAPKGYIVFPTWVLVYPRFVENIGASSAANKHSAA